MSAKRGPQALRQLARRWWWLPNFDPIKYPKECSRNPVAGLKLHYPDGQLIEAHWMQSGWKDAGYPLPGGDYLEAAFRYEVQARYSQKEQDAAKPLYEFCKAFPRISQTQKEELKKRYPSPFQVSLPICGDLRRPELKPFLDDVAKHQDPAAIELWFRGNLRTMRDVDLKRSFKEHLERLRKKTGIPQPKRPRQKDYPWHTLETADRWLSGGKVEPFDVEAARNLLMRYAKK